MKITFKVGLLVAAVWIAIKMVYHFIGFDATMIKQTIFINMFFCLIAVAGGLYLHKRETGFGGGDFLSDIKAAMGSGVLYAVLVSLFLYFYYEKINPNYNRIQIENVQNQIDAKLNTEEGLAEIRAQKEEFEVMSKEEIREKIFQGPKSMFNATSTMSMSMLGMVVLATFYSIVVTAIFRNVLFREHIKAAEYLNTLNKE